MRGVPEIVGDDSRAHAAEHEQDRDHRERDDGPAAPAEGMLTLCSRALALGRHALRAQPLLHLAANRGEPRVACAPRSA